MRQRRAEAWERFAVADLPTEAEEVWRYSGIDTFDLDRFSPRQPVAAGGLSTAISQARLLAGRVGERCALVVTVNGQVAEIEIGTGVPAGSLDVEQASVKQDPDHRLGELATPRDAFGHLHDAFMTESVLLGIRSKARLDAPVVLVHLVGGSSDAEGLRVAAFPHTVIDLGESAGASVVEVLGSLEPSLDGDGGPALVVPVTELLVGDGGELSYANVQVLGSGCVQVGTQASRVGSAASLRSFSVGLGAGYARLRTDSDLVGEGGSTLLLAGYLGTGQQVHDFRTLQDHRAPRTRSELLFKGALSDASRSVYSGLIRIRNQAHGADAFQTNNNLVLSEGARAYSVPNLDIQENDVRCSHASTVGPVDEDQLYYLESRGIRPDAAERLVVAGFFAELAQRSPVPGVGLWMEQEVASVLGLPAPARSLPAPTRAGADGNGEGNG